MIATLRRTYTFEAAHRLPHVCAGHKCGRVHGHSYRVTVHVQGEVQTDGPERGMVCDFARIDAVAKPIIGDLDHSTLNDHIGLENATSEILAAWLACQMRHRGFPLYAVSVRETASSEAFVLACDVDGSWGW
jgi:6-pyruvoyltetrahydropterin/6-carboxytetrahydropterin synthase